MRLEGLKLFTLPFALTPGLQTNPKERVVTGPDEADQVEDNHARGVLDSRCICENPFHLSRRGAGASLRRGIRELQTDVQISLIFIGEEARGQPVDEENSGN